MFDRALAVGGANREFLRLTRVGGRQAREPQLGQAGRWERPLAVARAEQHDNTLGVEASGGEDERVRRHPVEPLRVVDEAEQRAVAGVLRQEGEDREADEHGFGGIAGRQAQCRVERAALRLGEGGGVGEGMPVETVGGAAVGGPWTPNCGLGTIATSAGSVNTERIGEPSVGTSSASGGTRPSRAH